LLKQEKILCISGIDLGPETALPIKGSRVILPGVNLGELI